jgi:hypothetical protein
VQVTFARAHCRVRARPLAPPDDPLAAVDAVVRRDPWLAAAERASERGRLRAQAARALGPALGALDAEGARLADEASWTRLKARAARAHLSWDGEAGRYRAGQPGAAPRP